MKIDRMFLKIGSEVIELKSGDGSISIETTQDLTKPSFSKRESVSATVDLVMSKEDSDHMFKVLEDFRKKRKKRK